MIKLKSPTRLRDEAIFIAFLAYCPFVTLKLRLSGAALRRLRSAAKHAFAVRLSVRLRAPDHRLVTVAGSYTLDGSALYAPLPPRTLSHGVRRRALARTAC